MKKEVLLAIILGFGIGLLITFGIYTAQKAVQQKTSLPVQDTNSDTIDTSLLSTETLQVFSPENESLTTEDSLVVSGMSIPDSQLAILTTEDHLLIETDSQGNFSQVIDLKLGPNYITIVSIDATGSQITKELIVTKIASDLETSPSATESAESQ